MANIGTFTKANDGFKGEIVTMSVQQKNVRIVREEEVARGWSSSKRGWSG